MTKKMDLERLYKNFEFLPNWEERYRFIIDLGKKIPGLSDEFKTDENRVQGCVSMVHLVIQKKQDAIDKVAFLAESDSSIVNGLIAILHIVYDDKTAEELKSINVADIFSKLGLEKNLSPNRRNGFFSMVQRLTLLSEV